MPHYTSAGFSLAPGGGMALTMSAEYDVIVKYAKDRHRRWLQWAEFCALGDGMENEYELYSMSQSNRHAARQTASRAPWADNHTLE